MEFYLKEGTTATGLLFTLEGKRTGMGKTHLDETMAFIREHRSSEGNFEKLYAKLEEEANRDDNEEEYKNSLSEIKKSWYLLTSK
jgi:hypothetical protein